MYQPEPEFKGTAQLYMPIQSLFGSTQASALTPSRVISVPISPRSSRSDQIGYRPFASARYQLPVNTFASWPVYTEGINSVKSDNSRIFRNQKRDQILQKYKSPVLKNMKIINYGPIEVQSATPTLKQTTKSIKRTQSPINITFKQKKTKTRQTSQPKQNLNQLNHLQNRRYHDYTHSFDKQNPLQETKKIINDTSQNITYNMTLNNTTIVDNCVNTSASIKFLNLVKENITKEPKLNRLITFNKCNSFKMQQTKGILAHKNLWVWVACLVCCIILIGLLIAM